MTWVLLIVVIALIEIVECLEVLPDIVNPRLCATTKAQEICGDYNPSAKSMLRPWLVTGLAHVGTHWSSGMLNLAGAYMPHENGATKFGSVSWEYIVRDVKTPHGVCMFRYERIVHILRYPLGHIKSITRGFATSVPILSFFKDFVEKNPGILPEHYMDKLVDGFVAPGTLGAANLVEQAAMERSALTRMMAHWVSWTTLVVSAADVKLYMETLTLGKLCYAMNLPCSLQNGLSSATLSDYDCKPNHNLPPKCMRGNHAKKIAVHQPSPQSSKHKGIVKKYDVLVNASKVNWTFLRTIEPVLTSIAQEYSRSWGYCASDVEENTSGSVFCGDHSFSRNT